MKKLIVFLFLLGCAFFSFSQEKGFLLRDINLPESFKDRIITYVEKDQAGLLWFVTNNGLYRYDGNEVIRFDKESNPAVLHSSITVIFADREDRLWIGAEDGLTRFDLKTWTTTLIKAAGMKPLKALSLHIRTIGQGQDGTVYAGSEDGKLYRVNNDSLEVVLDISLEYPGLKNMPSITSVQEPYPGQLWLSTAIGKLIRIQDGNYSAPEYFGLGEFHGEVIREVFFHPSGECLLSITNHGLYSFNTITGSFEKVHQRRDRDLGRSGIVFLAPLNSDEVLLFTNQPSIGKDKLFIYKFPADTITEQTIRYPEHLKDNHIDWLLNTGNSILISLNNHILELNSSKNIFRTLLADAVAINSIRSIYKHPGGKLYIGSYKDGFVRMNETSGKKEIIAREFVYTILPWNADTLLLGTEGGGLFWYETGKNRLTALRIHALEKGDRVPGSFITTLIREKPDAIWMGTYEGLFLVNPYTKTAQPVRDDRLAKTKIFSMIGQGEKFLISTPYGILQWNSKTNSLTELRGMTSQLKNYPVYCLTAVDNEIWAGTDGDGILIIDEDGHVTDTINNSRGLANNVVYSLLTTPKYVIAGTHSGLSIISRKTGHIRNYSRLDRLPVDEFNRSAAFQTGDTIYLGTVNGVVRFNTGDIDLLEAPRSGIPVHITSMTTEHAKAGIRHHYSLPYTQDSTLVIPSDVRYFSIGFGSLDESARQMEYYYRLHERTGWHSIGKRQEITFVEMPPGNYELQVSARLPDGQWSRSTLRMPLIVKPAFHQTIWFKILVALGGLAAIWAVLKYRENMLLKEKKLRLKIAGDLHDEVGSMLSGISMQADLLLSGRRDNKLKEYLQNIAGSGRDAVSIMGDIVWSIDPRNDDNLSLINRLKRYGQEMTGASGIGFTFDVHGSQEQKYLPQKVRQNIMLIFKEALTNIFKHAEATHVHVSFTTASRELKFRVSDNGKGLPDQYSGGHGLRNMQMRANAIGATLQFPIVEKGLTIVLTRQT